VESIHGTAITENSEALVKVDGERTDERNKIATALMLVGDSE
jgi:hypothetical protein